MTEPLPKPIAGRFSAALRVLLAFGLWSLAAAAAAFVALVLGVSLPSFLVVTIWFVVGVFVAALAIAGSAESGGKVKVDTTLGGTLLLTLSVSIIVVAAYFAATSPFGTSAADEPFPFLNHYVTICYFLGAGIGAGVFRRYSAR